MNEAQKVFSKLCSQLGNLNYYLTVAEIKVLEKALADTPAPAKKTAKKKGTK